MTNSPIALIREACIRANPEIVYVVCFCGEKVSNQEVGYHGCGAFLGGLKSVERDIRLADALLALKEKFEKGSYGVSADGRFVYLTGDAGENYFNFFPDSKAETEISWDLKNDSLDSQSPETLEFLASLLGKE